MRFTRLRLNGFKSFVDPTDLVIADGLTGIVGPNGCGKSNLLEALRWVMGEHRASALRGGGMEDVIFAGAATRPARNFAEVSLTIDNRDRKAPAGMNDSDTLEIIRRITRDAGSAYKVQGKDARARDVQMLFADASTGAHSPALVRQGQISELINAKPTARRRILEEAAGISGLYQRRHEAELKLKAAEQNLTRVDDVIDGLAAQLVQLGRQARSAQKYREIGEALRRAESCLLWRKWDEALKAATAAANLLKERAQIAAKIEAEAGAALQARIAAEDKLPALREEETVAVAILTKIEMAQAALAEEARAAEARITDLAAQIAQMERDAAREGELNRDADDTLARLAREADDIARQSEGHETRLARAAEAARMAATRLAEAEAAQATLAEDVARLVARHQTALRLIEDQRRTLSRAEAEAARAAIAGQDAEAALTRASAELADATGAEAEATARASAAEAALAETETARAETQSRESDARAARSSAEGEAAALRAEVAALTRLVERDGKSGGQVLDDIRITAGYEQALGAALADDLRLPADPPAGKTGWLRLRPYDETHPLPEGAVPMAGLVTAPPALARRIAQVGIVDAGMGFALQPLLKPGQRLVSREGDLWRWDGFHVASADAPSAAALRLQQMNRLTELKRELDEVSERAKGAALAHDHLSAELARLVAADQTARTARREADRLQTEAHRRRSKLEADLSLATGRRDAANLAAARHAEEADAARKALAEAEAAQADLPDLTAQRAALEAAKAAVDSAREEMLERRAYHDEQRRQGDGRARRLDAISRETAAWAERQANAAGRSADLAKRHAATLLELQNARALPQELSRKAEAIAADVAAARARRTQAQTVLQEAETALRGAMTLERECERSAGEAREARAMAQARSEAAREAVTTAEKRIEEVFEISPEALARDMVGDPDLVPPMAELETAAATLRRQRDQLGAVNLRAEDDARNVQAEHDTLFHEKGDLEDAIRALRGAIGNLNREGRERLLAAFHQVNANFSLLFTHLFGGGEARLELVESDDPLEAGLEIMCQPPGKKLSALSLLSGGEQTLTALALIFAVFLANPAPICVLDEVDAPLDDANVTRFCDLMDEMTRRTETRFLVITHHAVTMSRMDRLFGVTMGEQGVSQLVSVDLRRAEALVA